MYLTTTISYIVSSVWLLSVALEVTVNCERHDYEHHLHGHRNHEDEHFRHDQRRGDLDRQYNSDSYRDYNHDRVYPPRDDYHNHQSGRLHENDRYDRKASAYDSRPSYDRGPVYQDPLYYAPQHNNNNYHNSGPSYYHDDRLKHKSSSPHNPNVGLLKATAGNMLKQELNRSLNRGLHHAIHDVKHQLSPETRNTIRNLKNELIHNNPNAKAKRFSKKVDTIVKHGSLLAKALK